MGRTSIARSRVDRHGHFRFTETNAYSGNNGRAAILNNRDGREIYYTSGNAGGGANPQPDNVILGAGAQLIDARSITKRSRIRACRRRSRASRSRNSARRPTRSARTTTSAHRGARQRRVPGSGGNGVNTVYFVDTTGTACVGRRRAVTEGRAADGAARVQRRHAADGWPAEQHVRAGRFPEHAEQDRDDARLSVRDLVRRREHAVCRGRGRRLRAARTCTRMPLRRRRRACRSGFTTRVRSSGSSPIRCRTG